MIRPQAHDEPARSEGGRRASVSGTSAQRGRAALRHPGRLLREEHGAATAEYAITILAAVGFAGVLVAILKGDEVKAILSDLVHRALAGG
jgi:Flp pilus assembly pilin Flp